MFNSKINTTFATKIWRIMADNYLEKHYAEYEAKKAAWLSKKSKYPATKRPKNEIDK